ncbi:MAG TPA: hypothetical protein VHC39_14105 [Rhizomicrobium sp.]|nr:hypothetical protein [Rhizomicrobium sp.]
MADPKTYDGVGRCVYCGAASYTKEANDPLALEHIIPLALDGTLELPAASCQACERITGRIEQIVLRGSLRGIREHLGLKSRGKEGRPDTLPIFGVRNEGEKEQRFDVPIEDYPTTLLMLTAREALIFLPPGSPHDGQVWNYFATDIGKFVAKYGLHSFSHPALDAHSFLRMLGKIAHSFLTAEIGLGTFRPTLPDMILGKSEDFWRYIGGVDKPGPASEELHEISIEPPRQHEGRSYHMVRLRLFARLGAPAYLIAAGEAL